MAGLEEWKRSNEALTRTYKFNDFKAAMRFMNKCADIAEELNHHPEWKNVYNRVEVRLTTHDAGGVTDLDTELAHRMDEVYLKLAG